MKKRNEKKKKMKIDTNSFLLTFIFLNVEWFYSFFYMFFWIVILLVKSA